MKIENKITTIASETDPDKKLRYSDIILLTVNAPVKQGMDLAEMAKRVNLIEALNDSDEFIELDEEQTVFMRQLWSQHRWMGAHPDVLVVDEAVRKKVDD
jgi:hypothetical protein